MTYTFASSVSSWAILGSNVVPDVGVGAVGGIEPGPGCGSAVCEKKKERKVMRKSWKPHNPGVLTAFYILANDLFM